MFRILKAISKYLNYLQIASFIYSSTFSKHFIIKLLVTSQSLTSNFTFSVETLEKTTLTKAFKSNHLE